MPSYITPYPTPPIPCPQRELHLISQHLPEAASSGNTSQPGVSSSSGGAPQEAGTLYRTEKHQMCSHEGIQVQSQILLLILRP